MVSCKARRTQGKMLRVKDRSALQRRRRKGESGFSPSPRGWIGKKLDEEPVAKEGKFKPLWVRGRGFEFRVLPRTPRRGAVEVLQLVEKVIAVLRNRRNPFE